MNNELRKKNVLLFTLEYPPFKGGVANYYGNVVKYYKDDIFVLTGKKLLKPHWIFSLLYLWRVIKKDKINTVLVGHILPLGTVTWLLHKILKFDYIVFLHGMDLTFAMKVPRKKQLAVKILRDAKKVICVNSHVAKLLEDNFSSDIFTKVAVVNPGIHLRIRNKESGIKNELIEKYNLTGKKVLLQVGRLVERKGVDIVLKAMPKVLQECLDLVYVIIGIGPELKNYELRITNYELTNNVILVTDADDEELQAWYELCDIFIMPSRDMDGDFEGFGIVYLEANAHGKPVIGGDSGGVRDAVKDGVNGLLVNPVSTEEIKNAIVKLYKDDELRKKLGAQGKEWARKFEWEKQVEKIVKLLNC